MSTYLQQPGHLITIGVPYSVCPIVYALPYSACPATAFQGARPRSAIVAATSGLNERTRHTPMSRPNPNANPNQG
eukprot:scaffold43005_cov36-Phaeocystis_antarctica.AAC.1